VIVIGKYNFGKGGRGKGRIIFKHLHNYLLRYYILSDDQSGFRHRDSTINQLLVIYDVIMKNFTIKGCIVSK
jgi:hypothetical protein